MKQRYFLTALLALLGSLGNVAAAPPIVYEVDTTVDNPALNACTTAPNDCSLRGAITKANSSANPETITFSPRNRWDTYLSGRGSV